MFIGRINELNALNNLYQSNKFEFAVIYGRRRVGKTALINEFIKDKEAIYFTGVETNEKQNLEYFSHSIFEYQSNSIFPSFQDAFKYVFESAQNKRLILVIDEYPYVARASKSLASTLQFLIDQYKDTSQLMLILCGSSMSYMEDHVLAYKAPLYGRRTAQFKITPFGFYETCEYFTNYSIYDKALMYGIIGGTPQYILQMNPTLSVEENIKNTFLNPTSSLFEEPNNLLNQEVREPAIYNAIISAIANGATKMAKISTKVGEPTSVCTSYLNNLLALGLIRKETPFGQDSNHKSIYSIEDNMFKFWYRFIPENNSIISRQATDLAYQRIEPHLSTYMGIVFEEICKQYLWKLLLKGKSPINFTDLGRWWGSSPKTKSQEEIDIMGTADKNTALFCECKWKNEDIDLSVLETLIERSELFDYEDKYFYLFSKTGFTKNCIEKANELNHVYLIKYEDMFS